MTTPAHPFLLDPDDALFLLIDLQEKFLPTISEVDRVVRRSAILARTAGLLGLPVVVTEQYPRGLGPTVAELREALPPHRPIEKTAFSAYAVPAVREALATAGRRSILVAGIETHVCVLQTTLELLADGYRVWLVADALGSRSPDDRELALRQLVHAGATVTSTDSVLFQLMKDAKHPKFREVQALIK
jgi:nicotinamidase-related amidase